MSKRLRPIATTLGLTLVISAALAGYGTFRFGSIRSALAYARGE